MPRWLNRSFGTTERRLAVVILLTSVIPVVVTWALANSLFTQASALWFNREFGGELDRGLELAKDYVAAKKASLRYQALAISRDDALQSAVHGDEPAKLEEALTATLAEHSELFSVGVWSEAGEPIAMRARAAAVDESLQRTLNVELPLAGATDGEPTLRFTFTVPRQRLDELESSGEVVQRYHQLEASRDELYGGYLRAFTFVLVATALATLALGVVLARGVTKRIVRLGVALRLVAAGDLSVRVPVTGSDELTELAANFNRMIAQVAHSRARIEFLQRMSVWQEMARKLAHEIKNPLTPIQLAVEECQRRFELARRADDEEDTKLAQLMDTTVEIVREEVSSLRHLVEHFANFARLPAPTLTPTDMVTFVRDLASERTLGDSEDESLLRKWPEIELVMETEQAIVPLDRQLFRRVMVNLLDNAAEARGDAIAAPGRVHITVRSVADGVSVTVEDDGPGIPDKLLPQLFDPYVTSKATGTGLGLAIVKKVVVEHGGTIEASHSPRGGARFVIHLPRESVAVHSSLLSERQLLLAEGASFDTSAR